MADVLQNIAQGLLQNELFYVAAASFLAGLPPVNQYLQRVVRPASPPKQFHFSTDGAVATVTRTATVFPKPSTLTDRVYETIVKTSTAKYTTTATSMVPRSTTDIVTEQISKCVSTFHHNHYKTIWTHYPEPTCVETTTFYEKCTPTYAPETPCETVVGSPAPMPASRFPWEWTKTAELITFSILLAAGYLYHLFKMNSDSEKTKRNYKKLEIEHAKVLGRLRDASNTAKDTLTKQRNDWMR
jgi:hypothetical protein